jgi:hypothetical protein
MTGWGDADITRLRHVLVQAADDLKAAFVVGGDNAPVQRPYLMMAREKAEAVAKELRLLLEGK